VDVSAASAESASAAATEVAVELRSVTKRYGALTANDRIPLTVRGGEIHVLVGENGAGKSTLMGILSGTVRPDEGQVLVRGEDVTGYSPRAAIVKGVGMVHQHFRLVGAFTVAQNIALGFEPRGRFRTLDAAASRESARTVSDQFGLALDPDAVVNDLPVGLQQRVEIVKTLMRKAHVLIFDEPTAVLTEEESAALFAILRKLREDGRAIIFITHKLREALALADTISVLRRGKLVATLDPGETSVAELGTLMVGRAVATVRQETVRQENAGQETAGQENAGQENGAGTAAPAPREAVPLLAVRDAALRPKTLHSVPVRDLTIEAHPGELVSVLGVDGNGQQEIISLLTGTERPDEGTVTVNGRDLTGQRPGAFLAAGLGVVPADRQREGLVLPMSIARNLLLDRRRERRFFWARGLLLNERAVNAYAREMMQKYDIRGQRPEQPVASLSGGNQQKVVLARELERDVSVLVAANPTRGLDVGSIEYVHTKLLELKASGRAVVVVTSDLDEATALSDVICVLYRGAIAGVVRPPFSRHELGILMGGK
jgi:simple sugar transport system ATP-binding protein